MDEMVAVDHVPQNWNLRKVAAYIAKQIRRHLIPLGSVDSTNNERYKIVYLQFTIPLQRGVKSDILEDICHMTFDRIINLKAYTPKSLPKNIKPYDTDVPLENLRKIAKAKPVILTLDHAKILQAAHRELMMEMQRKFLGLVTLAEKTGNKIVDKIAKVIFSRLVKVLKSRKNKPIEDSVALTRAYRKNLHLHFADFQLIQEQLHEIEEASGLPKTELVESEFMADPKRLQMSNNMPQHKVLQLSDKYCDSVSIELIEHIKELDSESAEADSEHEVARKKIRTELKKITPYLSVILKQVIQKHFEPQPTELIDMCIYGEPSLPAKVEIMELLKQFDVVGVARGRGAYNQLRFKIEASQLPRLMKLDGTEISKLKLTIRPLGCAPSYTMAPELKTKLYKTFGLKFRERKTAREDNAT